MGGVVGVIGGPCFLYIQESLESITMCNIQPNHINLSSNESDIDFGNGTDINEDNDEGGGGGGADSKVHGANMGSIWGRQDPGEPYVGPMNFAIWDDQDFLGYVIFYFHRLFFFNF